MPAGSGRDDARAGGADIRSEVRALFEAARRRDPEERPAFLDEACAGRPDVRTQVEILLGAWDDRTEAFASTSAGRPALPGPGSGAIALVGHYIVHDEIGRGGMGVVYLADDTLLSRRVALKAIHPELSQRPDQRERLRREARASAALSHPGIATVYALEEFDGVLYLASEFVPGRTLRQALQDGPVPDPTVVDIAVQIARVLAVAHAQGVVHRDLKPENVIQTPSGIVKVLDFGLAQQDLPAAAHLTDAGTVVGTPAYMAPEQVRGDRLDFRVDLFALGVMLYELVSGRHPFEAPTYAATVDRILRVEPPPLATPEHEPSRLTAVVTRCLAKDPAQRYPSTPALVAHLEQVHATSGGYVPVAAPARHPSSGSRATRHLHARWWWTFHQIAISAVYVLALYPVWRVRTKIPPPAGRLVLFAALACAALATTLRLHLAFTARVYPGELTAIRARALPWTRASDLGLAVAMLTAAFLLVEAHAAWALLLLALAVVSVIASVAIEPATTRAAFGRRSGTVRARKTPS